MNVFQWFGADEQWQRPRPAIGRRDAIVTLAILVVTAVCLELMRSYVDFDGARPVWVEYLALAALSGVMLVRRSAPLTSCLVAFGCFFATTTWVPEVGYQVFYQYAFFFVVYSAVAWARDRRAAALTLGAITILMMLWLAWDFAMGQAIAHFESQHEHVTTRGLLPPVVAFVLLTTIVNIIYLGGAIGLGQAAWRQARARARLQQQAETIAAQGAELRDQAITEERLRIARELHDVVAHHVSVMGIQAAGARRLLQKDPATAADALEHVEESSRQAVTQMRSLLGTLRGPSGPQDTAGQGSREPQPTLAELPELCRRMADSGLRVDYRQVVEPADAAEALPLPVQLSLYRTVQEALTNVRRHSTAREASVTLRVRRPEHGPGWAEIEVLDDGRPVGGTSGSGLGLLGMRERVTSHGGVSEIGPRVTGGYRVRVRFPVVDLADKA